MIEQRVQFESRAEYLERIFLASAIEADHSFFGDEELSPLANALARNGAAMVPNGRTRFTEPEADMNPLRQLVPTLSPNIGLTLYPYQVFPTTPAQEVEAKTRNLVAIKNGPQALIHIEGDFEDEQFLLTDIAANVIYMGSVIDSFINFPYFLGMDHDDFSNSIADALKKVRSFINRLSVREQIKLSTQIARIGRLQDTQIEEVVEKFSGHRINTLTRNVSKMD